MEHGTANGKTAGREMLCNKKQHRQECLCHKKPASGTFSLLGRLFRNETADLLAISSGSAGFGAEHQNSGAEHQDSG
jgi:hypothetical protein